MLKYHMANSKGFAAGNSWLMNSSKPWREMPRPSSSFPSWPNYATAGGKGKKGADPLKDALELLSLSPTRNEFWLS